MYHGVEMLLEISLLVADIIILSLPEGTNIHQCTMTGWMDG
jgi:hypothetical protein